MNELVTSLEEVIENIKQFNKDLDNESDIVTQLSQFTHWYYIPSLNLFGPSKYIGYKNMTTTKYDRGRGKNGGDTERVLKEWFISQPKDSNKAQALRDELAILLASYDKKVRSNARIHVLEGGINY